MSQFELAIPLLLKHEGDLVNDPSDPGGVTNRGISFRYLSLLIKQDSSRLSKFDLNENKVIDPEDIRQISEQEIIELYRKEWWEKYSYGKIDNQSLATKLLDLSVNIGPYVSAELLQRACCQLAGHACVEVDGILGYKTYHYINQLTFSRQHQLLLIFCDLASEHYRSLIKKRPDFQKYLNGWLKRVYDFG